MPWAGYAGAVYVVGCIGASLHRWIGAIGFSLFHLRTSLCSTGGFCSFASLSFEITPSKSSTMHSPKRECNIQRPRNMQPATRNMTMHSVSCTSAVSVLHGLRLAMTPVGRRSSPSNDGCTPFVSAARCMLNRCTFNIKSLHVACRRLLRSTVKLAIAKLAEQLVVAAAPLEVSLHLHAKAVLQRVSPVRCRTCMLWIASHAFVASHALVASHVCCIARVLHHVVPCTCVVPHVVNSICCTTRAC